MKLRHIPLIMLAALALLPACKTTEANYRAAYETTIAHQREKAGDTDTPALQPTGALTPRDVTVDGGITLPLATAWLSFIKEADVAPRDSVRLYNVAVARFRQIFNARQMLSRLRASGYPGALILKTRDAYFVATASTSSPDSALADLRHVEADSSISLREPYPFIIRPSHLTR